MKTWDSNGGSTRETQFWYAVKVRERFEQHITEALAGKGIEAFSPMVTVRKRWSDRIKTSQTPLFSGYVFCRVDPTLRMPVLTIPGVQYFVGIGHAPEPVPDAEIESIRSLMRSGFEPTPHTYLAEGDRVRVWDGPLRGVEGVLLSTRDAQHLVISVGLLKRSVAVVIDARHVLPADAESMTFSSEPVCV